MNINSCRYFFLNNSNNKKYFNSLPNNNKYYSIVPSMNKYDKNIRKFTLRQRIIFYTIFVDYLICFFKKRNVGRKQCCLRRKLDISIEKQVSCFILIDIVCINLTYKL